MLLNYFRPRSDLIDYVRAYYYFESPVNAAQPLCAELGNIRIMLGGGGRMIMPDGTASEISGAYLLGPTMGAYSVECEPGTRVFGVGVRPRGWGVLFGVDASDLADQVVDMTALAGRVAGSAIEEIGNAGGLQDMAKAADRFFANLLETRLRRACAYPEALEQWLKNPDDLDLDRLMAMMDKSARQTDRLARKYFGASPKRLQRKYRTLRAADRIRAGARDWREAAGLTIYDQPHFIREFKTFIGLTPGQYLSHQGALLDAVQSLRKVDNAQVDLSEI